MVFDNFNRSELASFDFNFSPFSFFFGQKKTRRRPFGLILLVRRCRRNTHPVACFINAAAGQPVTLSVSNRSAKTLKPCSGAVVGKRRPLLTDDLFPFSHLCLLAAAAVRMNV
jgi:hypothetical protein